VRAELLQTLPAGRPPCRAGRHFDKPRRLSLRCARAGAALTDAPSKSAVIQARLAVGLLLGLVVLGVVWYGISFESLSRLWDDMLDRPGGPMTFRFILQPAMATIAALRDGVADARVGRTPYLSAITFGAEGRGARLWEGIVSTARILILGVVMDIVYQLAFLGEFYPAEAAIIAVLLAFVPYALLRGPVGRIARHWIARPASN